jgi:ABC-type multidrug transport system fused ATPase/permease subunit
MTTTTRRRILLKYRPLVISNIDLAFRTYARTFVALSLSLPPPFPTRLQDTTFFDEQDVGQLTSRLTSDAQILSRAMATNLNVLLRNALQLLTGTIYLAWLSPRLLAVTSGLTFLVLVGTWHYGAYTRDLEQVQTRTQTRIYATRTRTFVTRTRTYVT